MKELKKALKKCHDTAVGCDDIHYRFLKHLPFRSLDPPAGRGVEFAGCRPAEW